MLSLRSPVIFAAAPVGLALGAAAWLLLGGGRPVFAPIEGVVAQLRGLVTRPPVARSSSAVAAQMIVAPLFATSGPNLSVPDVAVRVVGLAKTPANSSALLSINNGPPEWLAVGATKDGITLQEVTTSKAVLETPGGLREVALGETSTPSPAAAGQPGAPASGVRITPPPGAAR